MSEHRVVLSFGDGGLSAKLICPESGCFPATHCPECCTDIGPRGCECQDEPAPDECWVKGWFDNLMPAEEILHGSFTVTIDPEFDGDTIRAHIVDPKTPPDHARSSLRMLGVRSGGLERPGARSVWDARRVLPGRVRTPRPRRISGPQNDPGGSPMTETLIIAWAVACVVLGAIVADGWLAAASSLLAALVPPLVWAYTLATTSTPTGE